MDERMKDIHLLLIYLNGFGSDLYEYSKKVRGEKVFSAWKGYLFDILNDLERDNLVIQYRKSMILTEKGIAKAKGLKEKYL